MCTYMYMYMYMYLHCLAGQHWLPVAVAHGQPPHSHSQPVHSAQLMHAF